MMSVKMFTKRPLFSLFQRGAGCNTQQRAYHLSAHDALVLLHEEGLPVQRSFRINSTSASDDISKAAVEIQQLQKSGSRYQLRVDAPVWGGDVFERCSISLKENVKPFVELQADENTEAKLQEEATKLFAGSTFCVPIPPSATSTTPRELSYPITRLLLSEIPQTVTSENIVIYPHRENLSPSICIENKEYILDYHCGLEDVQDFKGVNEQKREILSKAYELWKRSDGTRWEFKLNSSQDGFQISEPFFQIDDFSAHRQKDLLKLRVMEWENALKLDAEKQGMFYIKYPGLGGVGCFGYGAGLSMSTLDAVENAGGKVANFFDGGGGANASNAYEGIMILSKTPGVKVLFVNIFGGLTRCDWVAEGISKAVREMNAQREIPLPLVVRMRGTMSVEGNEYLRQQNLPIIIEPDFAKAAALAVEAANAAE